MPTVETAARRATMPVAIHLDHGASLASAVQAINSGCNGVMVDASHVDLAENTHITKSVAEVAHACGIPVEGELGNKQFRPIAGERISIDYLSLRSQSCEGS